MAYGVVRTDQLAGTRNPEKLVTLRYNDGTKEAEIENGMILTLDSLVDQDIWKAVAPAANQAKGKLVLVAAPEVMADEHKHNLTEFVNEAGADVRGYVLDTGDIYGVTADALDGTPDLTTNKYIVAQAKTTPKVGSSATNAIADLIDIDTVGLLTYYVFRVI